MTKQNWNTYIMFLFFGRFIIDLWLHIYDYHPLSKIKQTIKEKNEKESCKPFLVKKIKSRTNMFFTNEPREWQNFPLLLCHLHRSLIVKLHTSGFSQEIVQLNITPANFHKSWIAPWVTNNNLNILQEAPLSLLK